MDMLLMRIKPSGNNKAFLYLKLIERIEASSGAFRKIKMAFFPTKIN